MVREMPCIRCRTTSKGSMVKIDWIIQKNYAQPKLNVINLRRMGTYVSSSPIQQQHNRGAAYDVLIRNQPSPTCPVGARLLGALTATECRSRYI
jgi:hypothetical protein